jgi:outer membrane lipase/esterase
VLLKEIPMRKPAPSRIAPHLVLVVLATMLLVAPSPGTGLQAAQTPIVVFGTSLSDPGNAFALVGGTNTPPDYFVDPLLVPDRPYARGGHHFSNGPTWIEQFAIARGFASSAGAAFQSANGQATNYAVGAARAWEDGVNFNLSLQVDAFLQAVDGAAPRDARCVIEMGGNDIRDALAAGGNIAILDAAVANIAAQAERLYDAGARRFLIWRAPDISLTPAVRRLGPVAMAAAAQLSLVFNSKLDTALAPLYALLDIDIARLDAHTLVHAIVGDPAAFGLENVLSACLTPSSPPFFCQEPDTFLFWDGIHPSRAGHAILAREAAFVLGL